MTAFETGQHRTTLTNPSRPPVTLESPSAEEYTIVQTGLRKPPHKSAPAPDEDDILIDTTAPIPLNSKKTKRLEKQLLKKKKKTSVTSETKSFLDLPSELLHDVLRYLCPSDVLGLLRLNRACRSFILRNESAIAKDITRQRYSILARCFPAPKPIDQVDEDTREILLNPRRQELLNIHKTPYQHIRPIDPNTICSCTACVLAWNNLCLLLDLAHFQTNLNTRQPIPMIPRGTKPEWNRALVSANALVVERATTSPLTHAAILEKHLRTTTDTLLRQFRVRPALVKIHDHRRSNLSSSSTSQDPADMPAFRPKTLHPKRLYHLTEQDAARGTDEFLDRSGPPTYEFPYHRDNYYSLQAYVPNRKWDREEACWRYFDGTQHDSDLKWARQWFGPGRAAAGPSIAVPQVPTYRERDLQQQGTDSRAQRVLSNEQKE